MKIFITKYALTEGIIEADAELCEMGMVSANWDNGTRCNTLQKGEWWKSRRSANKKVREMQEAE